MLTFQERPGSGNKPACATFDVTVSPAWQHTQRGRRGNGQVRRRTVQMLAIGNARQGKPLLSVGEAGKVREWSRTGGQGRRRVKKSSTGPQHAMQPCSDERQCLSGGSPSLHAGDCHVYSAAGSVRRARRHKPSEEIRFAVTSQDREQPPVAHHRERLISVNDLSTWMTRYRE